MPDRNPHHSAIVDPRPGSGVRGPGSGVRGPGSGVRGPGTGDRGPGWDVFLSYARHDRLAVRPIVDALRAHGLTIFVDEAAVNDFDSISRVISRELARSTVLLAYYSALYPERRACQWELTAAYLAGQREGAPHRRVLVLNPEDGTDHIHPVELRDARHWPVRPGEPQSPEALARLADKVAAHVAGLDTPLGTVEALTPVHWLPAPPRLGAPAFAGQPAQLWRLHSALHPHAAPLLTGRTAASAVALRGTSRAATTALAEEYAVRFSAAFPGGIFWLSLREDENPIPAYARQLGTICSALGVSPGESFEDAVNALAVVLGRRGEPGLWVVDGVAPALAADQVRRLLAPHPVAATLLTTRGDLSDLATVIDVPGRTGGSAAERIAAYELQIELATRIGVQPLTDDQGGLREALVSLHALFAATRSVLHRCGPDGGAVPTIAISLLNDVLRPFLSRWHTELSAYEEARRMPVGVWEHERHWAAAPEFRKSLAALTKPLRDVIAQLAAISGNTLGL